MNENLIKAMQQGNYEETADGVLFPGEGIKAGGVFSYAKRGEPEEFSPNLIVAEGLTYLLGAALFGSAAASAWYLAIFGGNVTVLGSWTAGNFSSNATELTAYTPTSRPAWTPTAPSGGIISSYSAKASFTANATITVRGAALLSSSVRGGTTGTLLAASRFATEKSLADTEILDIGYQIQLTAS